MRPTLFWKRKAFGRKKIEVKYPTVQSKMDEIGVGGKKLFFEVS